MDDIIGVKSSDSGLATAGIGFVVVPEDEDRNEYIKKCYKTNTLTIQGGRYYSGYFRNVQTDIDVIQNIDFPTDENNRGSAVVWVKDGVSGIPIIISKLRKQEEYYPLSENQYRISRGFEKRNVELFIDGFNSEMQINLLGDKEESANIDIKLNSENKNSVFNINCDNEINITSENSVVITSNKKTVIKITDEGEVKASFVYELGKGFAYKDEFQNEVKCIDGEINIISNKINHNNGLEPMVLGNTLTTLLEDILKTIQSMTMMSPSGPTSVPVNIAEFILLQARVSSIKSQISNID